MDTGIMPDLLARLEAMAARLDEQATKTADLEAENARLRADVAYLKAAPAGRVPTPPPSAEAKLKRRGMLQRVLGATAAAALLTVAREAATAHAETRTTLVSGGASTTSYGLLAAPGLTDPTTSAYLPNFTDQSFGVVGTYGASSIPATHSAGVFGSATGQTGVLGLSDSGAGVLGSTTSGYGVQGETNGFLAGVRGMGHAGGIGVWGDASSRAGIFGTSTGSIGIFGVSSATNPNGTVAPATIAGVVGQGSGRIGVAGISDSNIGVYGESTSNIGVYGQSTSNYGCGGATSTPGFAGLFGYASVASAAGFLGVNGAPGGTAGYFHGAVTVDGPFQVVNGPKNALVAHPDGSLRKMYCQESPEAWFEDFGTAQLQAGKATVRLDPDFAAVVRADQYSVFPIPEGECEGVYIAAKTPNSFEVRELRGGTSSVPFSYRLVARRKDDVGRRMEKVDLPRFDLRPPGPPATPPGQDKERPR